MISWIFFLVIVKIFGHFRGFQDNLVIFDIYFNQTHLSFFGAFMVLNFLNEKKKVTQSKRYLLGTFAPLNDFKEAIYLDHTML